MSNSEMVQPTQGDIAAAKALVGLPADPDAIANDRAVQAFASYRLACLEEAARVCERQIDVFLSPKYALGQPLSSVSERVACAACAREIRSLGGIPCSGE